MSPAVVSEMQPDLHHDKLEAVGKAFDALLLTVYRLTHRQNELFQHMDKVFKEVNTHPDPLPPVSTSWSCMTKKSSRSGVTFVAMTD